MLDLQDIISIITMVVVQVTEHNGVDYSQKLAEKKREIDEVKKKVTEAEQQREELEKQQSKSSNQGAVGHFLNLFLNF
jgi:hypothetical protein